MLGAPEGGGLFSLNEARRPSRLRGGVDVMGWGDVTKIFTEAGFVSICSLGRGGEGLPGFDRIGSGLGGALDGEEGEEGGGGGGGVVDITEGAEENSGESYTEKIVISFCIAKYHWQCPNI